MEIAFRIYPLPGGTVYTEEDIKTIDDVILIFDYCQIMEAMISKKVGIILLKSLVLKDYLKQIKKVVGLKVII